METSVSVFHFSIMADEKRPLNYNHEYQVVYVEPHDGSHVFDIQLGERGSIFRIFYLHRPYEFDLCRLSFRQPYGYTASQ